MKRMICLTAVALLGLAASARASWFACCNHGIHCIVPPPPPCEDCGCSCDQGHHHGSCRKSERAHELIGQLHSECCCDRIKAAEKLGCRLHADFCCDPEVLTALATAVQCDPCWEVRRAAAWSIAYQRARTPVGALSLYLASKFDPHYMVRDAATDALAVLLVCRRECYKELFARVDQQAKTIRGKYKPGSPPCCQLVEELLANCGLVAAATPTPGSSERAPAAAEGAPGVQPLGPGTEEVPVPANQPPPRPEQIPGPTPVPPTERR